MASINLSLSLLFLSLFSACAAQSTTPPSSPYLSPENSLFSDYRKMLAAFRIYVYEPPKPFNFTTQAESTFYAALLNSQFVTKNPNEAHLFFLPFPADLSMRSLSRFVRGIRVNFPFWNRTLGADHFYLSPAGIAFASDRNLLELKKNSVQISSFPTISSSFIPHKDMTLPPAKPPAPFPHSPVNGTVLFLGFMKRGGRDLYGLVEELASDPEFLVDSEPSDLSRSKFCLFIYGRDASWLGEALRVGCVPAVITDRPIQDLPLMDVLRWSEMAVFVGAGGGGGGVKAALSRIGGERYERMRGFGVAVGLHFVWNAEPQPYDAFHMVIYQLWLKRHSIRYVQRAWI